ncbi:carbohydrate kinase [Romboutsia sedimentorum]|uniref:Carbohydrate kinase n=1 Tax=Romboutsia sedimentorum TaxID=1368474 RepID=A0ABT7ED95_9FIRM|nr:carbohydrate kinase [Romboutsia sedimentorum]MDK2563916.1 carbohydrate kinase [Romboutsia sedimentorum]
MKNVLCIGEALIDFLSIDKGKNLCDTSGFIKKAGGAPANVAAAISKLGAKAHFCGTVGDDAFGKFLENTFNQNNINTDLMYKLKDRNTTFAFVSLMEDGERDFEFVRDADRYLSFDMIEKEIDKFDLYHFGSATAFLDGELKNTYYKLKEYALNNNKLISFDANYRDSLFSNNKDVFINCCKDYIKDSDIVKLSEEEAYLISGRESVKEAADYLISLGCKYLIITLGKLGAMLVTKDKQVLIPTKEIEMKDATGAGDAFMGAVIVQILNEENKNIEDIVKLANLVGGITTTKIGALESIPTWDEVKKYNEGESALTFN